MIVVKKMRSIVLIRSNGPGFTESALDVCSRCTPLVEPQPDGSVFLDLSGCHPRNQILMELARQMHVIAGNCINLGLAASRLVARIAIIRRQLPKDEQGRGYRVWQGGGVRMVEVVPGQEQAFLSSLPLQEFPVLEPIEMRKLTRAAFYTVGEIALQPHSRLSLLLGKRAAILAGYSRGVDTAPVLGLYPPQQMVFPLQVHDPGNQLKLENQLWDAARALEEQLARRGAGCSRICLEMELSDSLRRERRLSQPFFQAAGLVHVLIGLWRQLPALQEACQGRVILEEIAALDWQEQDLFMLPAREREKSQQRVKKTVARLAQRFPGQVRLGREIDRREQVLALWDPWRSSGTVPQILD